MATGRKSSSQVAVAVGLIVLTAVLLVLGVLGGALLFGRETPSEVTASEFKMEMSFGLSRKAITRMVQLDLCGAGAPGAMPECVPTTTTVSSAAGTASPVATERPAILSAAITSDLSTKRGGQFPASQFTVTAANTGRQGLLVTVRGDPSNPDKVRDGSYDGTIVIERRLGPQIPISVVVDLESRGGSKTWKAIGVLLLGAIGGGATKWAHDVLAPLAVFRRRYRRITRPLRFSEELIPRAAERLMREVQAALRVGDTEKVSDALEQLGEHQDELVGFARAIQGIQANIREQEKLFDSLDPPIDTAPELLAAERGLALDLQSRDWPWQDPQPLVQEYTAAHTRVTQITLALRE